MGGRKLIQESVGGKYKTWLGVASWHFEMTQKSCTPTEALVLLRSCSLLMTFSQKAVCDVRNILHFPHKRIVFLPGNERISDYLHVIVVQNCDNLR